MTSEDKRSELSRADQLRQKRQQASHERVNTVHQQVTHERVNDSVRPHAAVPSAAAHAPSVTYRRSSPYATPNLAGNRPAPAARKLHYARGANGVEVRMPALPSIQINWSSASLFIGFALLLLVILLTNMTAFQVSAVALRGANRVTASDVTPIVVASSQSIFTLDRTKVVDAVKTSFPEFSSVSLKVGLPNHVILTVVERKPVLAWISGSTTQWISADGVVMPARGDGGTLVAVTSTVSVPAASASTSTPLTDASTSSTDTTASAADTGSAASAAVSTGPQIVDQKLLQGAISLASQMPSGGSLVYDPISGLGWQDPQGWKVFFGVDLSDLSLKQGEYQAILARLKNLGITPSLISVARVDSPYYKTE